VVTLHLKQARPSSIPTTRRGIAALVLFDVEVPVGIEVSGEDKWLGVEWSVRSPSRTATDHGGPSLSATAWMTHPSAGEDGGEPGPFRVVGLLSFGQLRCGLRPARAFDVGMLLPSTAATNIDLVAGATERWR
jgi:hypothetical protein